MVLSCTDATASRNYIPGLTEAYYRKLPIIALTALQNINKVGHLIGQVIDRSSTPKDITKYSAHIPFVRDHEDIFDCEIKINKAFIECRRNGGGPVHLNVETRYSRNYDIKELPSYRKIEQVTIFDIFPSLPEVKIGIFIGSHANMTDTQIAAIDNFCRCNNAVAFRDHTSSYKSKYALQFSILSGQAMFNKTKYCPDLMIHIGEVSGDYYNLTIDCKEVWRVNPDGEIRDTFKKLRYVFEMPIEAFFNHYTHDASADDSFLLTCQEKLVDLRGKIPQLPFSNPWIAQQVAHRIPENSVLHFGILNSLKSWNLFELPNTVKSMCNVGGFGIDGCMSSLIGASLHDSKKLYFLVLGDLAFFYDMNVAANRHAGKNIRILLVNNGKGTEFRNYNHPAAEFGEDADKYIAAAGHHGNKSRQLIKNYAENLGYQYIAASNKNEFFSVYEQFLTKELLDKPIIFEVFTNNEDESNALKAIKHIEPMEAIVSGDVKNLAKSML